MRIYGFEFGTLKGLEQIIKLVALLVKGKHSIKYFVKENYYEDTENSIVCRGTVICWNARQDNPPKWEPTGTGFWRPVVTPVDAQ